ncbi:hypothetical protein HDU92_007774 [Lobulomyces angularis]|nr:hypothetical protein HDU92_007774 [Lobulomyces angularis]
MIIPIEIFDIIINYSDDIAIHINFNRKYKTLIPWNMKFLKTIDDKIMEGDIEYIMKLNKAKVLVKLTDMIYYKLPFIIKFRCSKLLDIDLIDANTKCLIRYDTLMYYDRHDVINKLSMSAKDHVKDSDFHIEDKFEWGSEERLKTNSDYNYYMDLVEYAHGSYEYRYYYLPYKYNNVLLKSNSIIFDDIAPFTFGCTGPKREMCLVGKDSYKMLEDVLGKNLDKFRENIVFLTENKGDYHRHYHEDWIQEKDKHEVECINYCWRNYE